MGFSCGHLQLGHVISDGFCWGVGINITFGLGYQGHSFGKKGKLICCKDKNKKCKNL